MPSLFDGITGTESVTEVYDCIEANSSSPPRSNSTELWKLRRRTNMDPGERYLETLLERSIAIMADREHMSGWFNQCPVASGIVSSHSNRRTAVDLVRWSGSEKRARLVELKWRSDTPQSAIWQVLKYGVAYLFCRVHKDNLPLDGRPLMDARDVALEVVAPFQFFQGNHMVLNRDELFSWLEEFDEEERNIGPGANVSSMEMAEYLAVTSQSLNELAQFKTNGALSMSLNALAMPAWFDHIPFENIQDANRKCNTNELSEEGRMVRNAFEELAPAWPEA